MVSRTFVSRGRVGRWLWAGPFLLGLALGLGCASGLAPGGYTPKRLDVPDEMLKRKSDSGKGAEKRYVVRLADRGRVWEMELPEGRGGYEMRVPLSDPLEAPTEADEEMMADALASPPAQAGSGEKSSAELKSPLAPRAPRADEGSARKPRRSYLGAVASVSELYGARKYELALIEVGRLEKDYPKDARLHAMKGSLYLKLGKKKLARESWEKALALNPTDLGLTEALRELSQTEESL